MRHTVQVSMGWGVKLVSSRYFCFFKLKTYGPCCLEFNWDISDYRIWDWMTRFYPKDGEYRLRSFLSEVEYQSHQVPMRAYFDNLGDAMLFKMSFA